MGTPPKADDTSTSQARGALWDALGAVRNLEQLLKSVRVGPKALVSVIPDVHGSCRAMIRSAEQLALEIPSAQCRQEFIGFVVPRMRELEAALAKAKRGTLKANLRLRLEQVVTRVLRDLESALGLVDFLREGLTPRFVTVQALELIRESTTLLSPTRIQQRMVSLQVAGEEAISIRVNPRAVMALFAVAVGIVSKGDGRAVRVTLSVLDERRCAARIEQLGDASQATLQMSAPIVPPPLECCSDTLSEVIGARLERHEDSVTLILPRTVP